VVEDDVAVTMTVSLRPAPRVGARSCLATAEIIAGVTLAHTWAGGELPSVPWLLGLCGLVLGSSLLVMREKARLRTMILLLGAAQFALHPFLALMAPTEHVHTAASTPMLHLTWQMVAAHAACAVVTGVVWAVRRRALEAIFGWVENSAVLLPLWLAPSIGEETSRPSRAPWWLAGAPRRGPPLRTVCS
jgi:hypothetical protein